MSLLLGAAGVLQGQENAPLFPEHIAAGRTVALRVPEVVNRESTRWRVRLRGDALLVDGDTARGPWLVRRVRVQGVEFPGGGDRAVVQLAAPARLAITVDAAAFGRVAELLAPPAAADTMELAEIRKLGDSTRTLDDLRAAREYGDAWGAMAGYTRFRNATWLDLGYVTGGTTWNSNVVDPSARLAYFTRQELLPLLRRLGGTPAPRNVEGLALRVSIAHQNLAWGWLLSPLTAGKDDALFYLPFAALRAFLDADITDQEFIDRCFVLTQGNRTKVDLSARWR